jgi:hypothetical protein
LCLIWFASFLSNSERLRIEWVTERTLVKA